MLLQIIANAIFSASTLALIAMSISLVYGTSRMLHIGIGASILTGSYGAMVATNYFNWPIWTFLPVAGLIGALTDLAISTTVLRAGRLRGISHERAFVLSLAALTIIQGILNAFGSPEHFVIEKPDEVMIFDCLGVRMVWHQCVSAVGSLVVLAAWAAVMRWTSHGKLLQAIVENPTLCATLGISTIGPIYASHFVAGSLAGLSGGLIGLDSSISPNIGLPKLLVCLVIALFAGQIRFDRIALYSLLFATMDLSAGYAFSRHWSPVVSNAIAAGLLYVWSSSIQPNERRV